MIRFFVLYTFIFLISLQATEFTWTGSTSAQLDLSGNWLPSEPPPTPAVGDIAKFSDSANQFSPLLNDSSTFALYLASFNEATTGYTFQISNNSTLTFGIAGDTSQSLSGVENISASSVMQTFTVNDGATLDFLGLSNASINQDSANVTYNIGTSIDSGIMNFNNNSSAGSAIINVGDITGNTLIGGMLNFNNNSTAGSSQILAGDHSGMTAIHFYSDSNTVFSTASNATIQIGSTLPTIKNVLGTLTFNGFSSAGNATINIFDQESSSELIFLDSSTADHAIITLGNVTNNMRGTGSFHNSSTAAFSQFNVTNGSMLEFNSGSSGGQCSINLTNSGLLNFPDPGAYTIGSLTGDSSSLVHLSNATLTINYNGSNPIEMAGQISDAGMGGSLIKTGSGTLELSGTNTYHGLTTIQDGILVVNGKLTGNLLLTNGQLSGVGSIDGNVTTTGGVIAPGNSIGTLHIGSNYVQNATTTYLVQIDQTSSSLLDVQQTANLTNAPIAILVEGPIAFHSPYLILRTGTGISGSFADPVLNITGNNVNTSLLQGDISYENNLLAFLSIGTNLQNGATTSNQKHVAEQLDSIRHITPCENNLLNALVKENSILLGGSLDQLSGEPYSNLFYVAEMNTLQCIQNLLTPLHPLITASENCYSNITNTFWLEASGGRSFLQNSRNSAGLHMDSYQLSIGEQSHLANSWVLGGALFYGHDSIHFHVNTRGSNQTFLGSLYTLFRPSRGYILANLICGYSKNSLKRRTQIGDFKATARGNPKISQFTFYAEGGLDWNVDCFLMQPFAGIETSLYCRQSVKEHGGDCTNLKISQKDYRNISSRLGIHFNYIPMSSFTTLGLDIAWQHRFTNAQNHSRMRFLDFGNSFDVEGVAWNQDSLAGSLFLNTPLIDSWKLSGKLSGQLWENATTYNFLLELENSW